MKENYPLCILLLSTLCGCELLQTPWEKNNMASAVRHNSESLYRHDQVLSQLLKWFQSNEGLFSKVENLTEIYYQKIADETKSEEPHNPGFKSPEYRKFFKNLTDLISSPNEEAEGQFIRGGKYQQHGGFLTATDKDLFIEQLQNHVQQMNEFEESLKNLSERITIVETNSKAQMNQIANVNRQIKSNVDQLQHHENHLNRHGALYGNLSNTVASLEREKEAVAEHDRALKILRKDLNNKTDTINQIKGNLATLYGDMTSVGSLLLNPQARQIQNGSLCPHELDDGDFCTRFGHNDKCYCFITSVQLIWGEAERYCRWQGMYLLSIETEIENHFIRDKIKNKGGFWTSGRRLNRTSDYWIWASTGMRMEYEQWKNGEPNGKGTENCVELWYPFRGWNDKPCSTKHNIICKA